MTLPSPVVAASADTQMTATRGSRAHLNAFGWSVRAWAQPWRDFLRAHPDLHVRDALEIGAGPRSSLTPLLLPLAERVECSAHDATTLAAARALNERALPADEHARVHYSVQDLRALQGRWDLIVLKSVLGGVHRTHDSNLDDVHASIDALIGHLNPGGWLISLDNGRTALEPLWSRFGARRNGWRFFRAGDFPPATARHGFGVLSGFSAATRLGGLGRRIDDALYVADLAFTPLARQHAVLLHAWQRPT